MKREVIQYILNKDKATWQQGLIILQKLNPSHPLLAYPDTVNNRQSLLQTLGHHLRSNELTEVTQVRRLEVVPTKKSISRKREKETAQEPPSDLSTEARINLDIHRMIKELRFFSRKLQAATSDFARQGIYSEANKLNEAIEHNKKLLRQLQQGSKVKYVNTYFEKEEENEFEVPSSILELDKKYRLMMSRRSKKLKKAREKEQKHGTDSPQHQQALAEWKHKEEVVNFLKSKLDEHTKANH